MTMGGGVLFACADAETSIKANAGMRKPNFIGGKLCALDTGGATASRCDWQHVSAVRQSVEFKNDEGMTKPKCVHAAYLFVIRYSGSSFSARRSQRNGGFVWQKPSLLVCDCNRPRSAVTRRVARPECFPGATRWRRKKRF